MLWAADALIVRMAQVPRCPRQDEPADELTLHQLRVPAVRTRRAANRARRHQRHEATAATTMLRGRVQRPSLRRITDSLAPAAAETLMGGMSDKLPAAGVAEADAKRLPTVGQTCPPVATLAAKPAISVHRSK